MYVYVCVCVCVCMCVCVCVCVHVWVYILVCPHAYAILTVSLVVAKFNFDWEWESLSSVMHPVIPGTLKVLNASLLLSNYQKVCVLVHMYHQHSCTQTLAHYPLESIAHVHSL